VEYRGSREYRLEHSTDDNIVWSTGRSTDDNIVWSTAAGAFENIVWSTSSEFDNIVWKHRHRFDNIVWSTGLRTRFSGRRRRALNSSGRASLGIKGGTMKARVTIIWLPVVAQ